MKICFFRPCVMGDTYYMNARRTYAKYHNYEFKEGEVVRHMCDRKYCVEVTHLELGTRQDNIDDMTSRNRQWSKLSPRDVKKIRELRGKMSQREVGELFGITKQNVSLIQGGHSWKHLS